jgi:hypothetical protein
VVAAGGDAGADAAGLAGGGAKTLRKYGVTSMTTPIKMNASSSRSSIDHSFGGVSFDSLVGGAAPLFSKSAMLR